MKNTLLIILNIWRVFPAFICFKSNKFRVKCKMDVDFACENLPFLLSKGNFSRFAYLILRHESFRNVFLNRLHRNPIMYAITRIFFSPCKVLYINMPPEKIGGGLYFQHGFSTILAAFEIGERCKIFQQVTIGYNGDDAPVLGNDVTVTAGAIVIGKVYVGNGSVIGAGSVVTHDVADNTVVAGVPARFIKNVDNEKTTKSGFKKY